MEQPTGNDHSLEQLVGLISLAIVIILVIIFWLIKPQVATLKDVNAQVSAKNNELTATSQKLASMNALSSEIKAKKDIVNKLNIVLPLNDPEIADVIMELNTIASKSSVDLKSLVPSQSVSSSSTTETASTSTAGEESSILNVVPYEINFSISGDYKGIQNFFNNIEKNLKSFKIKSVNISSSAGANNPTLSTSIVADTYYQQLSTSNNTSSASETSAETSTAQ